MPQLKSFSQKKKKKDYLTPAKFLRISHLSDPEWQSLPLTVFNASSHLPWTLSPGHPAVCCYVLLDLRPFTLVCIGLFLGQGHSGGAESLTVGAGGLGLQRLETSFHPERFLVDLFWWPFAVAAEITQQRRHIIIIIITPSTTA